MSRAKIKREWIVVPGPRAAGTNFATTQFGNGSDDQILSLEFPADGKPSRKVVTRSKGRPTSKYPSQKMGKMIECESPHERNAYLLLDADPSVVAFHEQPCVIRYRLNGIEQRHYPDCLVTTLVGKALWEVKTEEDANSPEIEARTRFLCRALPACGYQYVVVTGEEVSRQPRLASVEFVRRQGRQALAFEDREFARRIFSEVRALRWIDVLEGRHAPFTINHACRLLLDGDLTVNFDLPLDSHALITRTDKARLFGVLS